MSYVNITDTILNPVYSYVGNNWVDSDQANFCEKQFLARGAYLGFAPLTLITCVIDTAIGVGSGAGAIIACGTHKATNIFATNHLRSTQRLLAYPYVGLLLTINPKATFGGGEGIVADYVINSLKNTARDCQQSDNPLTRHVASRLSYALLAISALVARAVDGVIGVIAALFSFLTVGYFEPINNLAVRGLDAPGIIKDLFCCAIKFINPWADGVRFGRFS